MEDIFKNLQGCFDTEEPSKGHEERFLEKLNHSSPSASSDRPQYPWWKALAIAASLALLLAFATGMLNLNPTLEEQVADISPEVANTQFYFASLIEEQVKELEAQEAPETKQIISDTLGQLNKLENDYRTLENELLTGGNSKLILSAMVVNFQTRINLLNDVLNQIDKIKKLKDYEGEMNQTVL